MSRINLGECSSWHSLGSLHLVRKPDLDLFGLEGIAFLSAVRWQSIKNGNSGSFCRRRILPEDSIPQEVKCMNTSFVMMLKVSS